MRENRNGVIWCNCQLCGNMLPENVMEDTYHAQLGIIQLCQPCHVLWCQDDEKTGMSMEKRQGWSRQYQDWKNKIGA